MPIQSTAQICVRFAVCGASLVHLAACGDDADKRSSSHGSTGQLDSGTHTAGSGTNAVDSSTGANDTLSLDGSVSGDTTASRVDASIGSAATDGDTDAATGAPAANTGSNCLDGIKNYAKDGPFQFAASQSGRVKLWVPSVPAGCKVPIIHFANGTGASCSNYRVILERLATHGFLATCYEDPSTAEGTQCVTAIETARLEHPDLVAMKVGSAGHEQGGGAALLCLYRAEQKWGNSMIYAGQGVSPVSGLGGATPDYQMLYAQIKSPVFMFTASMDNFVPPDWVQKAYDALTSERYWYEATGATYLPLPLRWAQESAIAWFRWKLLGDEAAGAYFRHLPDGDDWSLIASSPGK